MSLWVSIAVALGFMAAGTVGGPLVLMDDALDHGIAAVSARRLGAAIIIFFGGWMLAGVTVTLALIH